MIRVLMKNDPPAVGLAGRSVGPAAHRNVANPIARAVAAGGVKPIVGASAWRASLVEGTTRGAFDYRRDRRGQFDVPPLAGEPAGAWGKSR
jgi:hypothetical protein